MFMNVLKKTILWFMMLGMVFVPVRAELEQKSGSSGTVQSSYFTKVTHYLESDNGISQIFNLTSGLGVSVGLAYFYLYLQQNTQDMVGNQTMKVYYPGDIDIKLSDI